MKSLRLPRAALVLVLALLGSLALAGSTSPAAELSAPPAASAVAQAVTLQTTKLPPEEVLAQGNAFLAERLTGERHYFVQLSDTHVGGGAEAADGGGIFGAFHPSDKLARALDVVCKLEPAPDFIVLTGDLSDHGLPAEWAKVTEILAEHATIPTYLVRGNHDANLVAYLEAFGTRPEFDAARMATTGACYAFDWQGCRMVCLDSESYATASPQADWLREEIATAGERTVLAFDHRHLRPTGNALADRRGAAFQQKDFGSLETQLLAAPGFSAFFCGHVHHSSLVEAGRYRQLSLTSTFYSLDAGLSQEGGLTARLVHADAGKLLWTALADLDGGTKAEWEAGQQ